MSYYKYQIYFTKRPLSSQKWFLLITVNRRIKFLPVIINEEYKASTYILKIDLKNIYESYLNSTKKQFAFSFINFYFYLDGKFVECKRIKLKDLNIAYKGKKFSFGSSSLDHFEFKIILKESVGYKCNSRSIITQVDTKQKHYNKKAILVEYTRKMDNELRRLFDVTEDASIIYYDLDPFGKNPILSSIIMDKERSDESFWLNMLQITKKLYRLHNISYNWASMFGLKNQLVDKYILENKKDVYLESWFTRVSDCDEAYMIYQLVMLFMKCHFTNQELIEIKDIIKKKYYPFIVFASVTLPSFSSSSLHTTKKVYHWIFQFIPQNYFRKQLVDPDNKLLLVNSDEEDLPIIIVEPTGFNYPIAVEKEILSGTIFINGDRRMRTFKPNSNFYQYIGCLYTTEFLKNSKIQGFYCGLKSKKKKKKKDKYMAPFYKYINKSKKVVFKPNPKLTDSFINIVKKCAEKRMPIPDFLFTKKKHQKTFETTEDIDWKVRFVRGELEKLKATKENTGKKDFAIFSLDDFFDSDLHILDDLKRICKVTSFEQIELVYKNYFYIVNVLRQ